jgi:biotin operon repressor
MSDERPVKPTAWKVAMYLEERWPNFVSVPELIRELKQTDIRKRVSELCAAGYDIEKERNGRFINYRWSA